MEADAMQAIQGHITRCLVAGIVAIIPLAGVVAAVIYLETQLAGSWLQEQGFYFYGLGLLATVVLIYVVGLVITSFLGRWLWSLVDRVLDRLPLLGSLYQTLKQVLGYGEGPDAVFRRAVRVHGRDLPGYEVGLVTAERPAEGELTVFVPTAPNPSSGRLLVMKEEDVEPLDIPVTDVLKFLVSIGGLPLAAE